jgi:hypothetical protein
VKTATAFDKKFLPQFCITQAALRRAVAPIFGFGPLYFAFGEVHL